MEPQQPSQGPSRPVSQPQNHPQPQNQSRPPPHIQSNMALPKRTANTTPTSSPGPFSPSISRLNMPFPSASEGTSPAGNSHSPLLHPLQSHRVRETHKALVDTDYITGRKVINRYEIIDELGRGVHGKVKLARNKETGENVAIKIIPRFSKKRKLGKISTVGNQDKSKREIAILKKIRHPNVVALLEVIDDPELSKIYMILEHVELGEVVWRKKGLPHICAYERRRVEREMRGEQPGPAEALYELTLERRQATKDAKRARISQSQGGHAEYWSLEHGTATDDENELRSHSLGSMAHYMPSSTSSMGGSRATSRAPSRTTSYRSVSRAGTPHPSEPDPLSLGNEEDMETPGPLRSNPTSLTALDASMIAAYDDASFRGRSPSMADSIISHMSSIDYNSRLPDPYVDDFSYVPCFTIDIARSTFRDTVLGLEYLHYEGVVHRDIKPANLLWTREYRVKISDFGVSYFGRPIRDGEADDAVSESEAQDFDNDLELAKTVGTPAFFAPELCYTDSLDAQPGQSQPKITEQIDVWSLGVTLYCLIFARIPFLAEDEWQMFRKIATEEVYIPTKRLRPVDPTTKPDEKSLYARNHGPRYRSDQELTYEEIEPELRDLLQKMLTKQPEKRIRLRDVKRHPWVVKGIPNVVAWLDDTEPARRTSGRRIQVDAQEMEHAVVPISIFERARSAVKKAVDKVMHPRGDRAESASRKRATSSAASSGGESPATNPPTPFPREFRRRSLRGDRRGEDYFTGSRTGQPQGEHPLTYSVTASPHESPVDGDAPLLPSNDQRALTEHSLRVALDSRIGDSPSENRPRVGNQKALPSLPRHTHTRSVSNAFTTLIPGLYESRTVPPTPCFDDSPSGSCDDPSSALRKARDTRTTVDDTSRARSVDRGLFVSPDKRAEAMVSLSTAVAPGALQLPRLHSPQSNESYMSPVMANLASPLPFHPGRSPPTGYPQRQLGSPARLQQEQRRTEDTGERPATSHRIADIPEAKTPPPKGYRLATAQLPASTYDGYLSEDDASVRDQNLAQAKPIDASMIPCPPSPDDGMVNGPPALRLRENTVVTAISSSSTSMGNLSTPLTSPSEATSPISIANPMPFKGHNAEQILAFQSDPSLPALLSSTSSVSADLEGEFLGNPGVPSASSVLETTDSLTPPALTKESMTGFPLEAQEDMLHHDGTVAVKFDNRIAQASATMKRSPRHHEEDDDDSDSDEGLVMAKSRNHHHSRELSQGGLSRALMPSQRRDTNGSARSTDTAQKLGTQGEQSHPTQEATTEP